MSSDSKSLVRERIRPRTDVGYEATLMGSSVGGPKSEEEKV